MIVTLDVSETPAEMTQRRRVVRFNRGELRDILACHCRENGVEISEGCTLNVWGIEHDHGRDSVALCIDGD